MLAAAISVIATTNARAQIAAPSTAPEPVIVTDENGVNLITGSFNQSMSLAQIGSGGALTYGIQKSDTTTSAIYTSTIYYSYDGTDFIYNVAVGGNSEEFVGTGGWFDTAATYTASDPTVSKLERTSSGLVYTGADGTEVHFVPFYLAPWPSYQPTTHIEKIIKPDGEVLSFGRIQSGLVTLGHNIESSLGFHLSLGNVVGLPGDNALYNIGYGYCNVTTLGCDAPPTGDWPTASSSGGSLTNAAGETSTWSASLPGGCCPKSTIRLLAEC